MALLLAMRQRNPDDIKKALLESEIDLNEPFTNGLTPLVYAMKMNLDEDILSLLLEKGANIDKHSDKKGATPLHYAIKYHPEYVKYLLDKGANVNITDFFQETPLHYAVSKVISTGIHDFGIVKLLLEHGAIVTYENENGETALDLAADEYIHELMGLLIDYDNASEQDVPFIIIPKGTLLFNAYTIPGSKTDTERLLRLFDGVLPYDTQIIDEGDHYTLLGSVDRFQQKFFYSNPVGTGGIIQSKVTGYSDDETGQPVYPTINVFETRRDLKIALLMSPGPYHRTKYANSYLSPVITCDRTPLVDCQDHEDNKCKYGYQYDACIPARVLQEQSLDGHVAIAGQDSYLQVTNGIKSDRIMKSFVPIFNDHTDWNYYELMNKMLSGGLTVDTIAKDKDYNIGFPEIVLHPFGTDWYADSNTRTFEIKVDGAKEGASIVKKLIKINEGDYSGLGITNSLQLLCSINRDGINTHFRRLVSPPAVFGIPDDKQNFSLLAILFDAFNNHKISWKFNAHTGFLETGDGFEESLQARLENTDENRLEQSGLEFGGRRHRSRTYKKKRRARKTRKAFQ
jgi:hypothetical protein